MALRARTGGWLRALALAATCLALAAPVFAAAEDFQDPAAGMRVTKLDNGLTVLTLEDHTTPVVSFQVWVRVGSGDEARWTGLAHLFEHMMFRGSEHLGPEQHARLVESRGGRLNAFTSRDTTVFFEDVTSESLPLVVGLEAERLGHLKIDQENLDAERQVVIEERRFRTENSPEGQAFENLLTLAFQAHPYRIPTVGWMSDLQKVGVAQCRDFFDTYYAANNLVVAIAGDFDTDATLALVRRELGRLRSAKLIPRNPTEEPEQDGERRAVVRVDVQAPILAMAWHAPPTGDPDADTLDVASVILSSGRTSRLYRALVYDEPVALSASGAYWELERAGLFYAFASVRPDASIDRAEELLLAQIERLRNEPVSSEELEKAKRTLEVGLIRGQGSAHALASRIAQEWVSFGRVRPLSERLASIHAVTAADVQRVAKQLFGAENRSVVRVVPPRKGKK